MLFDIENERTVFVSALRNDTGFMFKSWSHILFLTSVFDFPNNELESSRIKKNDAK